MTPARLPRSAMLPRARRALLIALVFALLCGSTLVVGGALIDDPDAAAVDLVLPAPRPGDAWVYNVSVLRHENGSVVTVPDVWVQVQTTRGGPTTSFDAAGRLVPAQALLEMRIHQDPDDGTTTSQTFRHDIDALTGVSYRTARETYQGIGSASLTGRLPTGDDVSDGEREYRVHTLTSFGGLGPTCGHRSSLQDQAPLDGRIQVAGACRDDGRAERTMGFTYLGSAPLGDAPAEVFGLETNTSATQLWFQPDVPVPVLVSIALPEDGLYRVFRLVSYASEVEPPPAWPGPERALPRAQLAARGPQGPDATGIDHPFPLVRADAAARGEPRVATILSGGGYLQEAAYRDVIYRAEADTAARGPYPGIERVWTLTYVDGAESVRVRVTRADAERFEGSPVGSPTLPDDLRETAAPPSVTVLRSPEGPYPDAGSLPERLPTVRHVAAAWAATGGALQGDTRGLAYGFAFRCADDACRSTSAEVTAGDAHWIQPGGVTSGVMATEEYASLLTLDAAGTLVRMQSTMHVEETYTETPLIVSGQPPAPFDGPMLNTDNVRVVDWRGPFVAPAVALTLLSLLIGLLYWLWPALKSWFGTTLFHRDASDLLANPVRQDIYGRIKERPGIHHKALMRDVGHGNHVLRHHLGRLQRGGLVTRSSGTGYTCYFPVGAIDRRLMAAAPVLKAAVSARVLDHAVRQPGASVGELAAALGVAPATLSYHLGRLRDAGLVEVVPEGRRRSVRATVLGAEALRSPLGAS